MTRKATYKTRDWGTSVYRTVRHNPIPTMLVGTGIAWLIRKRENGRSKDEMYARERYVPAYDDQTIEEVGDLDYPYARRYYETMGAPADAEFQQQERDRNEKLQAKMEEGRSKLETTTESLKRRASDMGESARETAQQWREKARESSDRIKTTASDFGQRAREHGYHAKRGFFDSLESNPLAVAGVIFAVGAAIGLLVPRTQKEREMMGSTRDRLADRAREAGREQMEKVRSVAHEAKEAAIQEAERQDLVDRPTVEKAEAQGRAAMHTAEQKSREAIERTQAKMERSKEEDFTKPPKGTPFKKS